MLVRYERGTRSALSSELFSENAVAWHFWHFGKYQQSGTKASAIEDMKQAQTRGYITPYYHDAAYDLAGTRLLLGSHPTSKR